MADRRMFSVKITESDAFLSLSFSAQALYLHLCQYADDYGFVNSPKRIARSIGAKETDAAELITGGFLIPFDSGVVAVKHWGINNYIRPDRRKPTTYTEELALLELKENGAYTLKESASVGSMTADDGQNAGRCPRSIGEYRLDKVSIGKSKAHKRRYGEYSHVLLTDKEAAKLESEYGSQFLADCIAFLDEYIEMKGYTAKSHYLAIRKWVADAVEERKGRRTAKKQEPAEIIPTYDDTNNPTLDKKRLEELMKRREA